MLCGQRRRRGSGSRVLCKVLHQRQRRVQLQGPQGEAAQHQALPRALQRQLQPLRQACSGRDAAAGGEQQGDGEVGCTGVVRVLGSMLGSAAWLQARHSACSKAE